MSHERPNIDRVRQMLREHDDHQTDEHDLIGDAAPPATEPEDAPADSEPDADTPQAPVT